MKPWAVQGLTNTVNQARRYSLIAPASRVTLSHDSSTINKEDGVKQRPHHLVPNVFFTVHARSRSPRLGRGIVSREVWIYHSLPCSRAHLGIRGLHMDQTARKDEDCNRMVEKGDKDETTREDAGCNRSGEKVQRIRCPCWNCGATLEYQDFFCTCGAVQPLDDNANYFEMFSFPVAVVLDVKQLEKSFMQMQKLFHPDLFGSKSTAEKEVSSNNSTIVNQAYQTLLSPMQRVKYLIKLQGIRVLEEDTRVGVHPDFLVEIMETRESLEACESQAEAEAILAQTLVLEEECLVGLEEALQAGDRDALEAGAVRLRYLCRIEDEAKRVGHRLEDELAHQ